MGDAAAEVNDGSWSASLTSDTAALPDGWRDHRRWVRRRGPLWALAAPSCVGLAAVLSLWGSSQWWRGAAGLALAVAAAPLLPVAGIPAAFDAARLAVGVGGSAAGWLVVGWLAARRGTRLPGASWPEWRREYVRLAVGYVVGGWAALVLAGMVVAWRAG